MNKGGVGRVHEDGRCAEGYGDGGVWLTVGEAAPAPRPAEWPSCSSLQAWATTTQRSPPSWCHRCTVRYCSIVAVADSVDAHDVLVLVVVVLPTHPTPFIATVCVRMFWWRPRACFSWLREVTPAVAFE